MVEVERRNSRVDELKKRVKKDSRISTVLFENHPISLKDVF